MRKLLPVTVLVAMSVLFLTAGAFAQAGPTLNTPSNGATDLTAPISFNWSSISYGEINNIVIDDDPGFGSPLINQNVGGSTSFSAGGFQKGVQYYWHVRVYVDQPWPLPDGWTSWSATWSFTTECPDPPDLINPISGSSVSQPLLLEWSSPQGAYSYWYQVDDDPAFGSPAISMVTTLTYMPVDDLDENVLYYWRVSSRTSSCTNGDWSSVWNFTIECPAPPEVVLYLPEYGSTVDADPSVRFVWTGIPDVINYNFQVDDNSDFSSLVYDIHETITYYDLPFLDDGVIYYWRARALNLCGYGDWSPTWNFSTSCPTAEAPTLTSPDDGAVDISLPFDLFWNPISGATDYHFQLDDDPGMIAPEIDGTSGGATTVNIPLYLGYGTTYYWQVQAVDACGYGTWSEIRSFTMECPPPGTPTLTSPADAAVDVPRPALLEWDIVSGASSYQIQIDDDPAFGSPTSDVEIFGLGSTAFHAPSLTEATTYYWKVRASDQCGWGEWSVSRSFSSIDILSGLCGDVNLDGQVTILDVIYTINYKYKNGPDLCDPPPKK